MSYEHRNVVKPSSGLLPKRINEAHLDATGEHVWLLYHPGRLERIDVPAEGAQAWVEYRLRTNHDFEPDKAAEVARHLFVEHQRRSNEDKYSLASNTSKKHRADQNDGKA